MAPLFGTESINTLLDSGPFGGRGENNFKFPTLAQEPENPYSLGIIAKVRRTNDSELPPPRLNEHSKPI